MGIETKIHSLNEAIAKIRSHCQPLPANRIPLTNALGRILRENVQAVEDLPPFDCSTRDGFAILAEDTSASFHVIGTIHAGDWRPRELKSGEAVRVATGAPLPCSGLRVDMQENVRKHGDLIQIAERENARNFRRRGEDAKIGQLVVSSGVCLDAGKLALLASAGHISPLVSPCLRVAHFTTGDEIIPPDQVPRPGQIRDSNSILIRSLLHSCGCEVLQMHLPEDFARAKLEIEKRKTEIDVADLILVSGGASVGDKDFTQPLLEWLGFEIIFSQVNIRPGKPLIFGVNGPRKAFGLPGNPLSHFVCFHVAVTTALAGLLDAAPPQFLRGELAVNLTETLSTRETFWPARLEIAFGGIRLHPLVWASSGDITCLATANALLRVRINQGPMEAGSEVEFLLTGGVVGS